MTPEYPAPFDMTAELGTWAWLEDDDVLEFRTAEIVSGANRAMDDRKVT
jgi:hypothetical protein